MRKIVSMILALLMVMSCAACGSAADKESTPDTTAPAESFKVGFGLVDITPNESVPMAGYGTGDWSNGKYSYLEAEALAVEDESGQLLVFVVVDLTYAPEEPGTVIRQELSRELEIPESHIILSGTHTHHSVDTGKTAEAAIIRYNRQLIDGVKEAVHLAVEDLKPADIYVGSVQTEGLTFVKRYIMDDGSLIADNYPGTGTTIVRHETEADQEMQLMKFVREGGKDILVANFQAHPHFDGHHTNISAEVVGAFRDAVKQELDVHCLYWQGAAGNLNSRSRIESEKIVKTRTEWGEKLCGYAVDAYDDLVKVESGPVKVMDMNYPGKVNHEFDDLVSQAEQVRAFFKETNDPAATADYAMSLGVGIHSVYHANRIVNNAKLPEIKDIYMTAWSFGGVGGVVMAQEMYDTTGMILKTESPFEKTFIISYAWPAYNSYIPTAEAFAVGGYEVDNCTFASGTAEELTQEYLRVLNEMHE